MHEPNPISAAAKASDEPTFREVGVGPWSQTHPGQPRPDDPDSPNYDERFDGELLDNGDRRNVLDRYRYWTVPAIKADLDARGRHGFDVAVENWTHDFNIGSMVRTANAFAASHVYIVGPHKWNRKGALMTELYQHVEHHPTIEELITAWRAGIADEIAALELQLQRIGDGTSGSPEHVSDCVPENVPTSVTSNIAEHAAASASAGASASEAVSLTADAATSAKDNASGESVNGQNDTSVDCASADARANMPETQCVVANGVPTASMDSSASVLNEVYINTVRAHDALADSTQDTALSAAEIRERLAVLRDARVIALDIIPGAVPMETYRFPERCLMLFGAEGPGLSQKAVNMADDVVYISQFGSVRSINAGAAAAVAMHAWIVQHATIA